MKRLILIALGALLFSSCDAGGYNDVACAQNARQIYPKCKIYIIEPHFKYLVVDSTGNVKVLIYGSLSKAKITRIEEYVEIK